MQHDLTIENIKESSTIAYTNKNQSIELAYQYCSPELFDIVHRRKHIIGKLQSSIFLVDRPSKQPVVIDALKYGSHGI